MCGVDDISDSSPRIHKVLLDITLLLYLMEGFFFWSMNPLAVLAEKRKG